MDTARMLAELVQRYVVQIWFEEGVYRVELTSHHSETQVFGPNSEHECRYAEPVLDTAIARAWRGETPDG